MKPIELLCTVTSFKTITPTVFELGFQASPSFSFQAGQFISVIIPGAGPKGRDLRRAYSIASSAEANSIELCIKLVEGGPGTQYLFQLRPEDTFKAIGPYGDFTYQTPKTKQACFIATGTGIAPFRSMVLSQAYQAQPPLRAICLLGVRTEDELLYADVFKTIPKLTFVEAVSQPQAKWNGFKGRVTDYLRSMAQSESQWDWLNTDYYLCGNGSMIAEVKAFLAEKGVPKESIHLEKYY
ncbi:MAG: ferredoxin--NADP reductase [Bdellovibrionia bacterium]